MEQALEEIGEGKSFGNKFNELRFKKLAEVIKEHKAQKEKYGKMTQTEQDHARKKDVCKRMCEYLNVEIEKDPSVM